MKHYLSREEFRLAMANFCSQNGFHQRHIDECYIQALQERRIAASFALAILSVIIKSAEVLEREDLQKVVSEVIEECQRVLEDDSVYIMDYSENFTNSKLLENTARKATEAVSHAGNLCNNLLILFSDNNIQEIIMQARDRCDFITKRRIIGDC